MKREDIKKYFPDATEEQLKGLLDINTADIGKAKGDFDKVKADLDKANGTIKEYETTIADLKKSAEGNEDFKKKFEELEQKIADEKAAEEQKAKEEAAEAALAERFKTVVGEQEWRDELTGEAVYSKFKAALADEANKGKGDKDILDALTKDQDYWKNPNKPANMTGVNKNTSMGEVSDDQIRAVMGLPPKKD